MSGRASRIPLSVCAGAREVARECVLFLPEVRLRTVDRSTFVSGIHIRFIFPCTYFACALCLLNHAASCMTRLRIDSSDSAFPSVFNRLGDQVRTHLRSAFEPEAPAPACKTCEERRRGRIRPFEAADEAQQRSHSTALTQSGCRICWLIRAR